MRNTATRHIKKCLLYSQKVLLCVINDTHSNKSFTTFCGTIIKSSTLVQKTDLKQYT